MTSVSRPGAPRSARQRPPASREAAPRGAAGGATGAAAGGEPRVKATAHRPSGPAARAARAPQGRAASRPGGPSGPGRPSTARNRIEPAATRGSWVTALSWRAAVLFGVVVLAAAVVLPSLRAYFGQQDELAELRAEAAAAHAEVEDLAAESERWKDPAFVVAQARERLAYVFPGETPYRVIDPETVEGAAEGSPAAEVDAVESPDGTWYTRLWTSVEEAGAGGTAAD